MGCLWACVPQMHCTCKSHQFSSVCHVEQTCFLTVSRLLFLTSPDSSWDTFPYGFLLLDFLRILFFKKYFLQKQDFDIHPVFCVRDRLASLPFPPPVPSKDFNLMGKGDKWEFLKWCGSCKGKLALSDGHSLCLLSLGEGHRVETCPHYAQFSKQMKKNTAVQLHHSLLISTL